MKYRKKPVVIEAVQLTEDNVDELLKFCGDKIKSHPMTGVVIETLEGNMLASKGDFIIKGVQGEFYPCKPDIFKQTYEPVKSYKEELEEQGFLVTGIDGGFNVVHKDDTKTENLFYFHGDIDEVDYNDIIKANKKWLVS